MDLSVTLFLSILITLGASCGLPWTLDGLEQTGSTHPDVVGPLFPSTLETSHGNDTLQARWYSVPKQNPTGWNTSQLHPQPWPPNCGQPSMRWIRYCESNPTHRTFPRHKLNRTVHSRLHERKDCQHLARYRRFRHCSVGTCIPIFFPLG